jgi:hypothetical protein
MSFSCPDVVGAYHFIPLTEILTVLSQSVVRGTADVKAAKTAKGARKEVYTVDGDCEDDKDNDEANNDSEDEEV